MLWLRGFVIRGVGILSSRPIAGFYPLALYGHAAAVPAVSSDVLG